MGGVFSDIFLDIRSATNVKNAVKRHVYLAKANPKYLEYKLKAVQFFTKLVEEGEGMVGVSPFDADGNMEEPEHFDRDDFLSVEVEIIAGNRGALDVLFSAIISYSYLELTPPGRGKASRCRMPFKRLGGAAEQLAVIEPGDVPRYRIGILRLALRCFRIICVCEEVQAYIRHGNLEKWFSQAAEENPLDDYVRANVRLIMRILYGGKRVSRRIALSTLEQVVDILQEFPFSHATHVEALKRMHSIVLREATNEENFLSILNRVKSCQAARVICNNLNNFKVGQHYEVHTIACRLFGLFARNDKICKTIGQYNGVATMIELLKFSRGIYFEDTFSLLGHDDYYDSHSLGNLTLADMAQQALWTLDNLSTSEYNRSVMKAEKLKYILKEILVNPQSQKAGAKLIVPRRLKQIDWSAVPSANEKAGEE